MWHFCFEQHICFLSLFPLVLKIAFISHTSTYMYVWRGCFDLHVYRLPLSSMEVFFQIPRSLLIYDTSPELRPRAFSMQLIDSRWRPAGLTPVSAHEAVNLCMGETSLYPNISSFFPPRLRNLKKYKSLAFIVKRKDTVNRLWWCLDRLQRTVGSKRSRQGMAGLSVTGDNPPSSDGTEWIFLFVVLHFCVFLPFICCFFIKSLFLRVVFTQEVKFCLVGMALFAPAGKSCC